MTFKEFIPDSLGGEVGSAGRSEAPAGRSRLHTSPVLTGTGPLFSHKHLAVQLAHILTLSCWCQLCHCRIEWESLRRCQASWLAGRGENVGTEKKKHVSPCCRAAPSAAGVSERPFAKEPRNKGSAEPESHCCCCFIRK